MRAPGSIPAARRGAANVIRPRRAGVSSSPGRTVLAAAALAVAALAPFPRTAGAEVTAERPFALLAARRDDTSWRLAPDGPGTVEAEATWSGGARLVLLLEGPDDAGRMASVSGESPLVLRFEVTAALAARTGAWRLAIANLGGRPAEGTVRVSWPGEPPRPAASAAAAPQRFGPAAAQVARARGPEIAVATPDVGEVAIATAPGGSAPPGTPGDPPTSGGGEVRTILPDGRVRVRYPDGTVRTYHQGCGYEEIAADGTPLSTLTCQQVQGAGFPPPPADNALRAFLEQHEEELLGQISFLVAGDAAAVDNYLTFEGGEAATVIERIYLRRRYVDRLLGKGL